MKNPGHEYETALLSRSIRRTCRNGRLFDQRESNAMIDEIDPSERPYDRRIIAESRHPRRDELQIGVVT